MCLPRFFVLLFGCVRFYLYLCSGKRSKYIMTTVRGLSELEARMGFASLCVEATAKQANCSYKEMYERLKKVGLIQEYVRRLDPVHTQSREYVVNEILQTLERLEKNQKEAVV